MLFKSILKVVCPVKSLDRSENLFFYFPHLFINSRAGLLNHVKILLIYTHAHTQMRLRKSSVVCSLQLLTESQQSSLLARMFAIVRRRRRGNIFALKHVR